MGTVERVACRQETNPRLRKCKYAAEKMLRRFEGSPLALIVSSNQEWIQPPWIWREVARARLTPAQRSLANIRLLLVFPPTAHSLIRHRRRSTMVYKPGSQTRVRQCSLPPFSNLSTHTIFPPLPPSQGCPPPPCPVPSPPPFRTATVKNTCRSQATSSSSV